MLVKSRPSYVNSLLSAASVLLLAACSANQAGPGQGPFSKGLASLRSTELSASSVQPGAVTTPLKLSSSGKCLDVNGSSTGSGVQLQQWDCNGTNAQTFKFTRQADKSFEIFTGTGPTLCVDISGGGTAPGTAVQQWSCNDSPAQRFSLVARAGGYEIHPVVNPAFCVGLTQTSGDNSIKFVINACNGGQTQLFAAGAPLDGSTPTSGATPTPAPAPAPSPAPNGSPTAVTTAPDGKTSLKFASSSKCLDVNEVSTASGVQLQQWECNGTNAQAFTLAKQTDGSYEIFTNTGSALCVDVSARGTAAGTAVQQWSCNDSPAQRFNLVARAGGYEVHPGYNAGFCLSLAKSTADNGVKVVTNPCDGSQAQLFGAASSVVTAPTPTPAPAPAPAPAPSPSGSSSLPAPIAGLNYGLSFSDDFTSLSTISLGSTFTGAKWYNGTEQCCMVDSSNLPGVMFPTVINGVQFNPYQLIAGGGLNIQLVKQNNVWFSGVLTSVDQNHVGFKQQYGYFEMTAQMPAGDGVWPAFWLLSTDPNMPGEIDIMEYYGHDQGKTFGITLHDWRNNGNNNNIQNGQFFPQVSGMTTGYHTYGLLWTESTLTFYFDGKQVWQHATPDVMKNPYYVLINNGLGGYWPTNNTPAKNDYLIKSVRAFKAQ